MRGTESDIPATGPRGHNMSRRISGVVALSAALFVSGCSGTESTGFDDSASGENVARFV